MEEGEMRKAKWTIMVYIAADDGLANFAIESLKQLRDTANSDVLVAAQFDADGSAESQEVRRFVFGKNGSVNGEPLSKIDESPSLPASISMTEPDTLANFINWARRECISEHYCLILWGHGPELLFEAPTTTDGGGRLYFTPVQLKTGLLSAGFRKNNKLAIIGMDACSMSMIEYAHELRGLAKFMVASQEEVPDLSFPYNRLVGLFAKHLDPEELCKTGIDEYEETYQDYICTPRTGMKKVTLSCVQLAKIDESARLLHHLVEALKQVAKTRQGGGLILEARKKTKGFVGGLFVDLCGFCERLLAQLGSNTISKETRDKVKAACENLRNQIEPQRECVVANSAGDDRCHGLSIYFPYLNEDEKDEIDSLKLVKGVGGSQQDTGKNVAIANLAARSIQYAVRRALIADTEGYYLDEEFDFRNTGWYGFIAHDWCRILVDNEPENLDVRYSAQQVAQNLLRAATKNGRAGPK